MAFSAASSPLSAFFVLSLQVARRLFWEWSAPLARAAPIGRKKAVGEENCSLQMGWLS
jgi:hypothetical protein